MPANWDIEVEPPATIAVLGAGPIGIETALYARFLGYDVQLIEQTKPAAGPIRWADRSLNATLKDLTSSLGRRALMAQGHSLDELVGEPNTTGRDWAELYLTPLAKSDLLADSILPFTSICDIGRLRYCREDQVDLQTRCNDDFRLLLQSDKRGRWFSPVDVVIDCTGLSSAVAGVGPGGMQVAETPEIAASDSPSISRWTRQLPRWRDKDQSRYAGQKVCLWGDSSLALAAARDWLDCSDRLAESTLIWVTPERWGEDAFARRVEQVTEISEQLSKCPFAFGKMTACGIERVRQDAPNDGLALNLRLPDETTVDVKCNHFVSLPDPAADYSFCNSLRVCSHTGESQFPSRVDESLPFETAEPHYYLLGSKTAPSSRSILNQNIVAQQYSASLTQIRELFALLGGRSELNLYDVDT